ncbi:Lactoylglutathione lyase [Candidatus Rhodobacter oscarellae]|uniref:Lactoylglutathione lyase n=1 Tax=Candidatus Rhodobacter oscarellae TaxID=1675527 RepID=A0A0J9E390_9RHOB|nr:VOC family protein [Candidatus Rhodobacter lobularis]KMW56289.1 Lactoylglutathione lyase [Candidatus Rhodobacter lobularis]
MEQRVNLITLAVDDLAKAAAFYEALGWSRKKIEEDGIIVFNLLGQALGLYPKEGLAKDMGLEPSQIGGFSGVTLGYNVRQKGEVDAIYRAAQEAGGRGLKAPHEIFWGGYSSYIADLDGHVWEIAWNPFSPPREDGSFQWGG